MEEQWFNECEGMITLTKRDDREWVIYKGFKITKFNEGGYLIQDVTLSDFYNDITEDQRKILTSCGFIKGADLMMHNRDYNKVSEYIKVIEESYQQIDRYKEKKAKRNKPKSHWDKKIRILKEKISVNVDLLFFYQYKVDTHIFKYHSNVKEIKNEGATA